MAAITANLNLAPARKPRQEFCGPEPQKRRPNESTLPKHRENCRYWAGACENECLTDIGNLFDGGNYAAARRLPARLFFKAAIRSTTFAGSCSGTSTSTTSLCCLRFFS